MTVPARIIAKTQFVTVFLKLNGFSFYFKKPPEVERDPEPSLGAGKATHGRNNSQ